MQFNIENIVMITIENSWRNQILTLNQTEHFNFC